MTAGRVRVRQLWHGFPAADGSQVEVLRGVDLEVAPGESVAVVGPSGSGKSTLLALLGALARPDRGEVWLDDQPIHAWDEPARAKLRGRTIGFVFQAHHLLPQLTALENVLVPAWAVGDTAPYVRAAGELLTRVGLGHRLGHRPGQLSGGECQRVAVARALLLQPRLLLADEPTGALDHAGALALADLLAELNGAQGTTLVVVTHSVELANRMQRRLTLQDGRLADAAGSVPSVAGAGLRP